MDHIIDISICVDNAAFGTTYDQQAAEVARILKGLADLLEINSDYLDPSYGYFPTLRDRNGNRVGSFKASALPIS